jgi:hypothetical protein
MDIELAVFPCRRENCLVPDQSSEDYEALIRIYPISKRQDGFIKPLSGSGTSLSFAIDGGTGLFLL